MFALPDRLAAKSAPLLIAGDEQHLAAVAACLERSVAELDARLQILRRAPGRSGQQALERDQDIHRDMARLHTLRRFGADLCLGRIVHADRPAPTYIGRLGLLDEDGHRLLLDWRSPAAEPFFAATYADPMGLISRRRYRWSAGRVTDYWDEVFDADALDDNAALDDQSAFIASLGASRSHRMRDVLATLAADQDAVIRAPSAGTLVVDGGPGTGKTVVALHRAAYLLYADPRVERRRGGVLFVGPHQPYLDYVADVLPGLGEDGVRTCTLRDLVAEGARAGDETDPAVARLKSSARLVSAIEAAVALYEEAPTATLTLDTPWSSVQLTAADWAEAFDAAEPGTPHNEGRDLVWREIVSTLIDRHDERVPVDQLRTALHRNRELLTTFNRAWPLLDGADVVGDLWTVPAYLRRCAPWLDLDDVRRLQRAEPQAWTLSDLPLLDAARRRVGDPGAARRRRRQQADEAAQREQQTRVIDDLIAGDDSELLLMTSLRHDDLRDALIDDTAVPTADPDLLAGPFAHVVVDEAQELTDAQWSMLRVRCPAGSFTVVGDRAQARDGFAETWTQRLQRVGLGRVTVATLSINYRTPVEIMAAAEPVIRSALPDANVPTSVRSTGVPVGRGTVAELDAILQRWLAGHEDGIACVIQPGDTPGVSFTADPRVRSLTPELAKGLEFDLVVLIDPEAFGAGVRGAVDRYVAMTRATQQLVEVTAPE